MACLEQVGVFVVVVFSVVINEYTLENTYLTTPYRLKEIML